MLHHRQKQCAQCVWNSAVLDHKSVQGVRLSAEIKNGGDAGADRARLVNGSLSNTVGLEVGVVTASSALSSSNAYSHLPKPQHVTITTHLRAKIVAHSQSELTTPKQDFCRS